MSPFCRNLKSNKNLENSEEKGLNPKLTELLKNDKYK